MSASIFQTIQDVLNSDENKGLEEKYVVRPKSGLSNFFDERAFQDELKNLPVYGKGQLGLKRKGMIIETLETGQSHVITMRGKPYAVIVPLHSFLDFTFVNSVGKGSDYTSIDSRNRFEPYIFDRIGHKEKIKYTVDDIPVAEILSYDSFVRAQRYKHDSKAVRHSRQLG